MNSLEKHFTIVDPEHEKYIFESRNSRDLVVAVGDSWTHIRSVVPRPSLYGNIISQELGSDWLNIAKEGGDNFWIVERVEEFCKMMKDAEYDTDYDTIYLICTFTETGRWFNSVRDEYIDYDSWFKDIGTDYNQIPKLINNECIRRIKTCVKNLENVKLLVGTAFTEQIGFDLLEPEEHLSTPWYRLIKPDEVTCYICTGGVNGFTHSFGNSGLEKYIKYERSESLRDWLVSVIEKANTRIDTLSDESLFDGTCHADEKGHKIWADHILNKLRNMQ